MEEKTHDPTPRRLRDVRKRGEVAFSNDVSSTLLFIVVVALLWLAGATGVRLLQELWLHATSRSVLAQPTERFVELLQHTAQVTLWACITVCAVAALAAVAGSFLQVGGLIVFSRLKPDARHLDPAEGLKRMFSTRSLVNLLKMLVKTLLLAGLLAAVVYGHLGSAVLFGHLSADGVMAAAANALLLTLAWAGVIYLVMGGVDYVHQRYEFTKQNRMSVDELRREYKESEGDPVNRSRRRSEHFEAVYSSLTDRVRVASAVIHSQRNAVALQYRGERDLPRVIARGEGEAAAHIRRLASEALIPMELDADLAERLYQDVPIDQPIPQALYAPVARLLRWAQGKD